MPMKGGAFSSQVICKEISLEGKKIKLTVFPPGQRIGTYTGAITTRGNNAPIIVQRIEHEKRSCLSYVFKDYYKVFYNPGNLIVGVYASPDEKKVAFLGQNSYTAGACMDLKLLTAIEGEPTIVAKNAWPWSHIAWSPDGKKIAYVKAKDGKIAIVNVPSNVVSVKSQK
jgi:dipeptidyl aminopeptidase/acylaminoacyl peptidase